MMPTGAKIRTAAALLTGLCLITAGLVTAEERVSPLQLRDVSVGVEIAHPLPEMTADELITRLELSLRRAEPGISIQNAVVDRIRLTVSVRPLSATMLRGFWLPFSGTYGIGTLRLAVERMVTFPDVPRPVPAVLWHSERTVGDPWPTTHREIARMLDDMVAELVQAAHRAATPRSSAHPIAIRAARPLGGERS